jgi:hypothetical protein
MIVEQAKQFENDLDENLVSRLSQVSSIDFAPAISVIGGMMTHDIVKAVTRYGCPVDQFMFYECSDVLPEVPPEPRTATQVHAILRAYFIFNLCIIRLTRVTTVFYLFLEPNL